MSESIQNSMDQNKKIIRFKKNKNDLKNIMSEIKKGWTVLNLFSEGTEYVAFLEQITSQKDNDMLYIPPRKKISMCN